MSCIWNIFHGSDSRCKKSPPRVTLITYQKSSACMNFPGHSKPSRPFSTVHTVDIFTLSLADSLYWILWPDATIIGASITHNISDSSIQHLSVGSSQYSNLTGPWGCMRKCLLLVWLPVLWCCRDNWVCKFSDSCEWLSVFVAYRRHEDGPLAHTNICIITNCREHIWSMSCLI